MPRILFLDKSQKDLWFPQLFDLYYENMHQIAPSGLSRDDERSRWLAAVSPALEKEPRKIILCTDGDTLPGYIQYYTRDDLVMVEEIQIAKDWQNTLLFSQMCRFLARQLPPDIRRIEAWADRRNTASQRLMDRLSMVQTDRSDADFLHFRGGLEPLRGLFRC